MLVPATIEMARGWRALGDDATISFRAYTVLSFHSPLVGQFSTTSLRTGHLLYDPGPLQYWLLTFPVHLDSTQGALWGAALVEALVLSLAIEGLWSAGRVLAGAAVSLIVLDLAWLIPDIFTHPTWNPNFAIPFVVTSIVLAWVVATGSLGWWPWLVLTASVAVQAELFFAVFAAIVVVAAPLIGLVRRGTRPLRWLVLGLIVAAICWAPAVVQQIGNGSKGNLSLLLHNRGGALLGPSFGFRSLAFAGSLRPIWTMHTRESDLLTLKDIGDRDPIAGVLVLVLMAIIATTAWWFGRRDLATLAMLGFLCAVATVASLSIVPKSLFVNLRYLHFFLWPVGILIWVVVLWAVTDLLIAIWAHRRLAELPGAWATLPAKQRNLIYKAVLVVCILALGALSAQGLLNPDPEQGPQSEVTLDVRAVALIEKAVPRGHVGLLLYWGSAKDSLLNIFGELFEIGTGAAWQLTADGWDPALPPWLTTVTGVSYPPHSHWPTVTVTLFPDKVIVKRTGR
jgi:hypothetical protein